MKDEDVLKIVETMGGNPVKELKYKKVDNLICGLVQDEIFGKQNRNYWVVCCWRPNGSLMPRYGGNTRTDLYLKIIRD